MGHWAIATRAVGVSCVTFGLFRVNVMGGDGNSEHNPKCLDAEDKDVVLIWNSGGWGRSCLEDDPDWARICSGIGSELKDMGYSTVVVDHIRSENNLQGLLREIRGALFRYPSGAKELADEVDLLTKSNSGCKVILVGWSNGSMFVNEVMKHLEHNPRVYSIQASRLFWYRASTAQRSLLVNGSQETADVLSIGNIWSISWENAWRLPAREKPPGGSVRIGNRYFRAPGHEYTWDQPGLRSEIISFLHGNFGSQSLEVFKKPQG